jgi:hypothetical protein
MKRGVIQGHNPRISSGLPLDQILYLSYVYRMNKQAISVTLDPSNLVWLRAQTVSSGYRSVSETLDRLIHEARTGSTEKSTLIRSVVGTIQIAESDPDLSTADAAIRELVPMAPHHRRRMANKKARTKRRVSHLNMEKQKHG